MHLTEEDFSNLIRGIIITVYTDDAQILQVSLAPMAWERMYFHIERAVRAKQAEEGTL